MTAEVEAVAGVDLALPVQRQMIAIFRDQQMRQHAGGGATARRRHRWRRRLGDRVAAPAGVFRADMADHPEPAGDIVENFGDVFAKPGHVAAASRTEPCPRAGGGAGPIVHRFVHDRMPRQVVRQGLALWPVCFPDRKRPVFGRGLADLFGFAGFQLLEPQFELLDVPGQSLRRAAELHPPQLGDLEFELLDFQGTQLDGELCCLQLGGRRCQFVLTCQSERAQCIRIGGQIGRGQRHTLPLSNVAEGD
jgi:hypothetical protein